MKDIKNILILGLIGAVIFLSQCNGPKPGPIKNILKTETKIDTILDTVVVKKPIYIPKVDTVIKTVEIHDTIVDTLKILGDYFSKKVYSDTIIGDSIKIHINDTIFKNSIYSRELNYTIIHPTIVIKKTKPELYWGFDLNGNKNQIGFIGAGLTLKTKQETLVGMGVGVNNELKPALSFKYYKKLRYGSED